MVKLFDVSQVFAPMSSQRICFHDLQAIFALDSAFSSYKIIQKQVSVKSAVKTVVDAEGGGFSKLT